MCKEALCCIRKNWIGIIEVLSRSHPSHVILRRVNITPSHQMQASAGLPSAWATETTTGTAKAATMVTVVSVMVSSSEATTHARTKAAAEARTGTASRAGSTHHAAVVVVVGLDHYRTRAVTAAAVAVVSAGKTETHGVVWIEFEVKCAWFVQSMN